MTHIEVLSYLDGSNEPEGFREVVAAFEKTWSSKYSAAGSLRFPAPVNVKQAEERSSLPPELSRIAGIRNPDFFFYVPQFKVELGGVEITGHSPDGSNVEKRYPFLWASRRGKTDAFVASYYLKKRPGGQINRLPYRHAHRNSIFLEEWVPTGGVRPLCQIVPIRELHLEDLDLVPPGIRSLMLSWADLGEFFAHSLAARVLSGRVAASARESLGEFKNRLTALAVACKTNTNDTDASTLIKDGKRWVQVYNTRPDSGHWERGEGQFDSIDGRLMFTLDEIENLAAPPDRFEFWLPQMVSTHPWIEEQRTRGFASKRLRNIIVVLKQLCVTKFADQLTSADWALLHRNSRLLLERLDWRSEVYRVADLVTASDAAEVARAGIARAPASVHKALEQLLKTKNLYFSAHRPYEIDFEKRLRAGLAQLPTSSTVLVPRIPRKMLSGLASATSANVLAAEDMTKEHLMMLRQIHRQGVPRGDE